MDFVVWREIKGYDKNYEISTDGRVREVIAKDKYEYLKKSQSISGYLFVELIKNNRLHSVRVDFLVACSFFGNSKDREFIIHKDGRKNNNDIENLKWFEIKDVDTIENIKPIKCYVPTEEQKAISSLKNSSYRNANAKTIYQFNYLGEFVKKWDCIADAERELNIKGISRACRKLGARAGGYIWSYEK